MTQAPVDQQLDRGRDEPQRTIQFSVFLENRVGKLLELLEVFEGQPLRIVALTVIDSADCAIVRLVTSDDRMAEQLLTRAKLPYSTTEIIVVEIGEGKTFVQACTALIHAEIFIHYAYPLMARPHGGKALALLTDDLPFTEEILRRKGFIIVGESDLNDPEDPDNPSPGLDHGGIT